MSVSPTYIQQIIQSQIQITQICKKCFPAITFPNQDNLQPQKRKTSSTNKFVVAKSSVTKNPSVFFCQANHQQKNLSKPVHQSNSIQTINIFLNSQNLLQLINLINTYMYTQSFDMFMNGQVLYDIVRLVEVKVQSLEAIFLLDILVKAKTQIVKIVFEQTQLIDLIVKQVQSFKQGPAQAVYLNILGCLFEKAIKVQPQKLSNYFQIVTRIIELPYVSQTDSLKMLKVISHYLNKDRNLRPQIVEKVIYFFQNQKQKPTITMQLIDCYLVLVNIVYHQYPIDLVIIRKLIDIMLYAKQNFSQKIVENYHNILMLIGILLKKSWQFQIQNLTPTSRNYYILSMFPQIQPPITTLSLTQLIILNLLTNTSILCLKQFSPPYLLLMSNITKYIKPYLLIQFFQKSQFLEFIQQCIDHYDKSIVMFALEILINLYVQDDIDIKVYIKNTTNIKDYLEQRYLKERDHQVEKQLEKLIDLFDVII